MEILAIIPARGGSKGISKKNIKIMVGKHLINYSIEAAIQSKHIGKIIISTDDIDVKRISQMYNIEVINRPNELAKDDSSTNDVIKHSLSILEEQDYVPDSVVLLQPTSPLRTSQDIDNSIELFMKNDCDSVISVCEIEHSPYWSFKFEKEYLVPVFGQEFLGMRRQELPYTYIPNGAIFLSSLRKFEKYNGFYSKKILPYVMPSKRSIDIDTELDFKLAELILSEDNERNKNRK